MRRGNPKGKAAEREVATLMEAWWRRLEPECRFVRTPQSGGWHGSDVREAFQASGDLMTTAAHFPWTVEVKRRESWTWDRLIEGKPSPVWGWWRQAQTQARELGKEPMLWIRHNREPWSILLPAWGHYPWTLAMIHLAAKPKVDLGEKEPILVKAEHLLDLHPSLYVVKGMAEAHHGQKTV